MTLTEFTEDVLVVLSGLGTASAREIQQEVEEYYASTVTDGRLYSNLNSLVEDAFIEKFSGDISNQYSLTSRGVEALKSRREWEISLES